MGAMSELLKIPPLSLKGSCYKVDRYVVSGERLINKTTATTAGRYNNSC